MERLKRAVTDGAIASAVIYSILSVWTGGLGGVYRFQQLSDFFNSTKQVTRTVCTWFRSRGMMGGTLWLKHTKKLWIKSFCFFHIWWEYSRSLG